MGIGAYAIYNTPAPKTDKGKAPGNMKGKGGISIIIIRTELTANIKALTKCNDRLIYMRIQAEKQTDNILLINSYAPHMEYKSDTRRNYWAGVKKVLQQKTEMDA